MTAVTRDGSRPFSVRAAARPEPQEMTGTATREDGSILAVIEL